MMVRVGSAGRSVRRAKSSCSCLQLIRSMVSGIHLRQDLLGLKEIIVEVLSDLRTLFHSLTAVADAAEFFHR